MPVVKPDLAVLAEQDKRLYDLADLFNHFHEGGQKSRANMLQDFWNAGAIVAEIENLVGYERGGGLVKLINEGRLKVGKTQCYRYRKLWQKFPVDGNLSLWEAGYKVDDVEEEWRRIQNGSRDKNERKNKEDKEPEEAPADDGWRMVALPPPLGGMLGEISRARGRDSDEVLWDLLDANFTFWVDLEEEQLNANACG
jgi:hypothetical protein